MAKGTFLNPMQVAEADQLLRPPTGPPMGQLTTADDFTNLAFSSWLGGLVENQFTKIPDWERADPIAIGSWGRGELCPNSDLDVLFCGPEDAVRSVVDEVQNLSLKLRYRVPEKLTDWTQGVMAFDVNALFWAKPFTDRGTVLLQEQQKKIIDRRRVFRRQLLKDIRLERLKRSKRYDSIANFLEPNIKYGAGALRDLQQAFFLAQWYPEKFTEHEHAFRVLTYYRRFFLTLRQKLHLLNGMDMLAAPTQPDLARWFGFEKNSDFMKQVQHGLARVSFHSDWVIERCHTSTQQLARIDQVPLKSWRDTFQLLQAESNVLAQYRIRRALAESDSFRRQPKNSAYIGRQLKKVLNVKESDDLLVGLFRSQIIAHAIPDFIPIMGLVQHDQYHRFTVDAHILQALREVKKVRHRPEQLGKLGRYCRKMKQRDWEILTWTALYHDIAKGRGGDHGSLGGQILQKDLTRFGVDKVVIAEVAWLVENHLLLSTAAFRKNPRSPKTWRDLYSQGVVGPRIERLALFTAIDIRATNPDAWSSWKEHLLFELAETLRAPSSEKYYNLLKLTRRAKVTIDEKFLEQVDMVLAESLPHKLLVNDFTKLNRNQPLPPLVYQDAKKYLWVRFHEPQDRKGLFFNFVGQLSSLGCNIRYAAILTNQHYGAYDWFKIRTTISPKILLKRLLEEPPLGEFTLCDFSDIQMVSCDEEEWVLSFKAKDRKGLLLSASRALYENDLQINWAQVHTWGRQIDDVFGVTPLKDVEPTQIVDTLRRDWVKEQLEVF